MANIYSFSIPDVDKKAKILMTKVRKEAKEEGIHLSVKIMNIIKKHYNNEYNKQK